MRWECLLGSLLANRKDTHLITALDEASRKITTGHPTIYGKLMARVHHISYGLGQPENMAVASSILAIPPFTQWRSGRTAQAGVFIGSS